MDKARVAKLAQSFQERDIDLNGTKFTIGKLLAEENFELMEILRPALGDKLHDLLDKGLQEHKGEDAAKKQKQRTQDFAVAMITAILGLPAPVIRDVRERLFRHVSFTNRLAVDPMVLAEDTGTAFVDLEFIHIYEMLVRCMAVNFTQSFRDLASRFGAPLPNSPSPNTKT